MHFSELTAVEQRVLGCLVEKRWTTPDQYPLSLNALRLACNQSTNRDPVTDYDESSVRDAAQRLSQYGLARLASGHGSRAVKYRHLAEEGLGLDREQLAVLCVLLLRGPQTPGELQQRTERMAPLASLAEVERVLGELADRSYAVRLGRRPGQKEDRWAHLLGGQPGEPVAVPVATPAPNAGAPPAWPAPPAPSTAAGPLPVDGPPSEPIPADSVAEPNAYAADGLETRVAGLESEVAALRSDLAALREQLADLLT